ncbi:MAG: universal stress protein [Deltaproteobacteria bacterium]|nr:universal stress protein [Deltaproteobacteria bacterium]
MFKKVLFPIDFSDVSMSALEYIIKLKNSGVEEVVVINIVEDKYFYLLGEYTRLDIDKFEGDIKKNITGKLNVVANKLSDAGYKVKVKITRGIPANEILKAEKEEAVSMIVIGSHGMSNLKEMFLGSVSETVVRKSETPVLVIKR